MKRSDESGQSHVYLPGWPHGMGFILGIGTGRADE